jgi:hypothetical protein
MEEFTFGSGVQYCAATLHMHPQPSERIMEERFVLQLSRFEMAASCFLKLLLMLGRLMAARFTGTHLTFVMVIPDYAYDKPHAYVANKVQGVLE